MFFKLICVNILYLLLFNACFAFNVEDRIPIAKQGPKHSLFGISVEQHYATANPTSVNDIAFLVGAPKTAAASYQSSDLQNPGALFKCAVTSKKRCKRIRIDDSSPSIEVNSSNSWLGVAVKSQKPGGIVAVCAHRFTIRGGRSNGKPIWEAGIGRCFMLDSSLKKLDFQDTYQPCLGKVDSSDGTYNQNGYGYCQAGTSFAFVNNTDEEIVIGMPGTKTWSGEIYTVETSSEVFFPNPLFSGGAANAQLVNRNSYVGFSVATGFSAKSKPFFVAGAPRGADNGQVVIYEKVIDESELKQNITEILSGDVIGSAFGYDVEIVDVNGDGKSDLLVGAPYYYDRMKRIGGAVYIYVNQGSSKPIFGPNAAKILYGEADSAFGTSITSIGDINMDGYNDFAVGAPGADQGIGRVYIYHGSATGVDDEPAQILSGANLYSTSNINVTGFGYAVSGGLDMDFNNYPDLIVGSLSDSAFLYRSRPVVSIKGKITPAVDKININRDANVNPNVAKVNIPSMEEAVLSFNLTVCLDYQAISFDEPVNVSYTVELDVEKQKKNYKPRVSFSPVQNVGDKTSTLLLAPQSENRKNCAYLSVYLVSPMQDKLSPFVFSLTYDIVDKDITDAEGVPSLTQYPISNKKMINTAYSQVNISKNCGEDEICESNLQMNVEYVALLHKETDWESLDLLEGKPVFMAGTSNEIGLKVDLENTGEDAHQATLKIVYPDYLYYSRVDSDSLAMSCNSVKGNRSVIICELGNPFRQNSKASFVIRFGNDERLYDINELSLGLLLNTSSVQPKLEYLSLPLSVKVLAQLKIAGFAKADQIPFSGTVIGESAVTSPKDVGLYVNHEYEIENSGRSEAGPVVVSVSWPYAIGNGKWLFYLLSYRVSGVHFRDDAMCTVSPDQLDPLGIIVEQTNSLSKSRRRRATDVSDEKSEEEVTPASVLSPKNPNVELVCPGNARCTNITCNIGTLPADKKIFINITGVVWNSTLLEEYNGTVQVRVFSTASVYLNRSNVLYSAASVLAETTVTSLLSENIIAAEYQIEWWIIALATAAGVILLLLLVLGLWKCGFFKRRRDYGDYHKAHKHRQASEKADYTTQQLVY